jgi:hypothetical protein
MEPHGDRRQDRAIRLRRRAFGLTVGRVYKDNGTSHAGSAWRWSMYAHAAGRMGNANGRYNDKTAAAAEVERAFSRLVAADER